MVWNLWSQFRASSLVNQPTQRHLPSSADIFRRATSQQPLLSGPVPDSYKVGPGDRLLLLLTGEVELGYDLEVTREGFVIVPEVGRITIADIDMTGAPRTLSERLSGFYSGIRKRNDFGKRCIAELRTIQVYLTGVRQRSIHSFRQWLRSQTGSIATDGPTDLGNLRNVRVRRKRWASFPGPISLPARGRCFR